MTHQGTKTLESSRLLLRPFTLDDAQAMYGNWARDPEISKYLSWPTHTSVEVSKEVLNSWVPQYENDDFYHWAIILKENGDMPIGDISVCNQDGKTKYEGTLRQSGINNQGICDKAIWAVLAEDYYR